MTGAQIRELREKRLGLTQPQLAQLMGVHPITVSRWERDQLQPNQHQLELLNSFARARKAHKSIGEEVAETLLAAGAIVALYKLLEAAFGDD